MPPTPATTPTPATPYAPPTPTVVTEKVKVTLNLLRREAVALQELADERGVSFTQAVREAIGTLLFIHGALKRNAKLLLEEEDGRIQQIVFR